MLAISQANADLGDIMYESQSSGDTL